MSAVRTFLCQGRRLASVVSLLLAGTCGGDERNPPTRAFVPSVCDSSTAKGGGLCWQDCEIPCGILLMGTRVCSCVDGVFSECVCLPPKDWQGAFRAPRCPGTGPATATALLDTPCPNEWDECIGSEVNTGTPLGCACLDLATQGGLLRWQCGSTNRWFLGQ